MIVRSDSPSSPVGQQPANPPRKFQISDLWKSITSFIFNMGLLFLTLVAVFCGWPDSPENLEKMGIYQDSTHL